jgi:DNA polymerase-3 subunit alpha
MFLIFDTETTGLPRDYNAPISDLSNWPRAVQIAWQLHDVTGKLLSNHSHIVRPDGFSIPYNAVQVHGISTERALNEGESLATVLEWFMLDAAKANYLCGHNIQFDINVVAAEILRLGLTEGISSMASLDTKDLATDYCAIPGGKGGKYKWPTLTELYNKLFGHGFGDAHDAAYDVDATARAFFELIIRRIISVPQIENAEAIVYEAPQLSGGNFHFTNSDETAGSSNELDQYVAPIVHQKFVHLHVHSQYSVLQSTSEINALVKKAKAEEMPAIAITDHGNMMAAFQFVNAAAKNDIKAIVGCEINLSKNRRDRTQQDNGYQIVLLAKNKEGYHNLAKLSSIGFTEGFYYVPRIDKEILLKYNEHLIATSGSIWGEIPWKILNEGEEKAYEAFLWWKEHFKENFFVQLNRHGLGEEDHVNKIMLEWCHRHGVKYFAANGSYYTERADAEAQDALICVREGTKVSMPKKYIGKKGKEFRYGLPNDQYYFKSAAEMSALFQDLPEALQTTVEIAGQCESYKLSREVLLPKFDIPTEFIDSLDQQDGGKRGENNYLRHLTYLGAEKRYGTITDEIRDRLDFELQTIANTGYPGYFLIVQDFCNAARNMGVSVGPGRGSAAGSAVAYCTGITNVDPIKYNLLFERFLNPERVSMPDIDIDFDDEGRDKVIDYVRDKYGKNMVAQIITYGTMGGKSAIRDTARVFDLPIPEADTIAKLMPDNTDLGDVLHWDEAKLKDELNGEDLNNAKKLREIAAGVESNSVVLKMAAVLEGSVRNTGIHACGVIITPDEINKFVPVALAKDSDMWCTQFDNSVVESAGLLKMDFLGLKTLTLIKDTLRLIKERKGLDIDIETIPLDDEATYQLFQKGRTVGIFQYESEGMQKHLRDLKPTVFDDLIAMNALYRPGPLEYIPQFIKRKHGLEEITYDLPDMEEFLHETYGICVYQEQVMLLSQKLAGFTKGEADTLRKAMGKKQKETLDKMKSKFIEGAMSKGHPAEKLEKIWTDWEAFASYAFNKSHSTCYAWVAYQTAYLKANHPAEYMAALLSNNMNDIKTVSFFMQECRKMGIHVLGPDVNESKSLFSVNDQGAIRFGLAAVKGVGENAVESIVSEQKKGRFNSIYDFLSRTDGRATSKRVLESLAMSGALDAFGIQRSAYFFPDGKNETFIETLVRYASSARESKNSAQTSLFGDALNSSMSEPNPPKCEPWDALTQLNKEKDLVGIFISGHPLDDFAIDIQSFASEGGLGLLQNLEANKNRELKLVGTVIEHVEKTARSSNKPFGVFKLEDYDQQAEFMMFGEDYLKYKHLIQKGQHVFVIGRVQQKKYGADPNALEYRISRIEPMYEVRDKLGKFLTITLHSPIISKDTIARIDQILPNGAGKSQLRFRIKDEQQELLFDSLNHNRVAISNEAIELLQSLEGLEIKLSEN